MQRAENNVIQVAEQHEGKQFEARSHNLKQRLRIHCSATRAGVVQRKAMHVAFMVMQIMKVTNVLTKLSEHRSIMPKQRISTHCSYCLLSGSANYTLMQRA